MSLMGPNSKIKREDVHFEMDCPDSLQDLCIFYLMNNLDILVPSLNKVSESNEGFNSSLTMLLGNKMLSYYSQWGSPCHYETPFVDEFVEKFNCCTELSITNERGYTDENLMTLAKSFKSVKKLHLTCFESHLQLEALRILCENNLPNLTTVVLTQKCEEDETIGYLNLLGGKDFDSDITFPSDSDDEANDNDDDKKTESESTGETNLEARSENETKMDTTEEVEDKSTDSTVTNLKSFSYYEVYSSVHPNLRPSRYFAWFFNLLSGAISHNPQLQSFRLVNLLLNPVEWFLSLPDLSKLQNLQSLSLSCEYFEMYVADASAMKIPYTDKFFTRLPIFRNLRHLDISCNLPLEDFSETEPLLYTDEQVKMFVKALKEMPLLNSLDISGTNLASIICHSDKRDEKCRDHCMPGFEGRRFEFLGLYGTEACTHKYIPADRVSGNASIDQLIEALNTLQHNNLIMSLVLNDIYSWVQEHTISSTSCAALIDGFIKLMTKIGEMEACRSESEEFEEKTIVTALKITYKLVVENGMGQCFTIRRKRLLLDHIMAICDSEGWRRVSKVQLLEYSMLLIVQLNLGNTALYSYRFKQFIPVLLTIFLSKVGNDKKVHAINELYTACNSSPDNKLVAGYKLKLVRALLITIEEYLLSKEETEKLYRKKSWKILEALTDGIHCNCEMFVENKGCQISKNCIDKHPDDKDLHKIILEVLVNVSANPALTSWLMTSDMVEVCKKLLSECKDSSVSYQAAGVLLRLVSCGPEAWTMTSPSRDGIIKEVDSRIHVWDVKEPISNDKFRSLSTLMSQLENYNSPVIQHWAAWNLCNLIIVTSDKFCDELEAVDGLSKIEIVLQHEGTRQDIVTLLQNVKTLLVEQRHH